MLFHELGEGFVANGQLAFEGRQFTLGLPNTTGGGPPAFKGGGSLFKKGFLPLVEEGRRDAVTVAKVADGRACDEVLAQDVHFLLRGVVAARCLHFVLHGGAHSVAEVSDISISDWSFTSLPFPIFLTHQPQNSVKNRIIAIRLTSVRNFG
jgi:hypothetical protein